jgi:hypothetical protein
MVHKSFFKSKGDHKNIENYRPIANLFLLIKSLKVILKRINEIQSGNNWDITLEDKHRFKHKSNT